jgi:integrase
MTTFKLKYVQRFHDRHGVCRHYFRKPGHKRVALPGLPGSAEFMEAYQMALSTRARPGEGAVKPGTVSALIVAYYQSADFTSLQPQTQRTSRLILDRFRAEYGAGPAARLEPEHLRRIFDKMGDKPHAAKNLLKRLRSVFRSAMARGLSTRDPTSGVRVQTPKSDGYRAWTDGDIEVFEARWPEGSRARLALHLLLYTGQRRSDVVGMGRQHLRGNVLHVRQHKTGVELDLPIHPRLKAELEHLPKEQLTFLLTAAGRPFTPVGFYNWFTGCAREAGLPSNSSPHGLRKAAARWLAEAGCSTLEIAAITGHQSLKEVERYTKSAAQARLAQSAMKAIAHR